MKAAGRFHAAVVGLITVLLVAVFVASIVTGLDSGGGGAADPGGAMPRPPTSEPRIRVEVLNAAGRGGLAREATRRLRARGFDVVYFGNAHEFGRETSEVVDRVGREEVARSVADALGIATVRSEPDAERLLEVTVLLGLDWPPPQADRAPGFLERLRRRKP
jgi:hypothetical protein